MSGRIEQQLLQDVGKVVRLTKRVVRTELETVLPLEQMWESVQRRIDAANTQKLKRKLSHFAANIPKKKKASD